MAFDINAATAILKQHYTSDEVKNLVYPDNPLFALVEKDTSFDGINLPIPVIYGNPQGASVAIGTAITNVGATKTKAFTITRSTEYGVASIDRQTMKATETKEGAFLKASKVEIDGIIHAVVRRISVGLYGDGTGVIGQISSGSNTATATITLADFVSGVPGSSAQVTHFEVGQVLVAAATSTGAIRTGTVTITNVDRVNGTLTASANWSTGITGCAASDYLFVQGDALNGGTVGSVKLVGVDQWVPMSATLGSGSYQGTLFGLDRTADRLRLAGIYYDGRGYPLEENLVELTAQIAQNGGRPSHCFLSFRNWSALEKALGSKVQYIDPVSADMPQVGFRGIRIMGSKGPIDVIPDLNCPNDRAYVLTLDTWKLYSLGDAPALVEDDGVMMLRDTSTDSFQVRVAAYLQLGCRAPGFNGVVQLA